MRPHDSMNPNLRIIYMRRASPCDKSILGSPWIATAPMDRAQQNLNMVLNVLILIFIAIVLAQPTSLDRGPSSSPLPSTNNLTANEVQVFCQIHGPELSMSQRKECMDAIVSLPVSTPEVNTFGPYERGRLYRTPISVRKGRCEATVDLRSSISAERSSWEEIKLKGFREIFQSCLSEKRQVGFARIGRYHNLELSVIYLHYGMDASD